MSNVFPDRSDPLPPPPPPPTAPAPPLTSRSLPPPLPAPQPVVASAIRFCKSCGDPWDPNWTACPRCSARQQAASSVAAAQEGFRADLRRVKSAIALYFALLGISIVATIVLVVTESEELSVPGMIAADIAMATITLAWCAASFRDVIGFLQRVGKFWLYPLAAAMAVGTFGLATVIVSTLQHLLNMPVIDYLSGFGAEGYGLRWAVLLICVTPAVFEELAFRGVILSSMEHVIGPAQALLVSSLLFAILHLSIPSIPHLFVLGAALAWLRQRSGSLYPCMLAHFAHNFLVILTEPSRSFLPW